MALPLAVSAERRHAEQAERFRVGVPGRGPLDVLVGLDGSPEAGAALLTVLDLLGPQLGRLPLATVIDLDASVEHDRAKDQALVELRRAVEGGYDLLAVGSRGAGLSKVLLDSTAATWRPGPRSRSCCPAGSPQTERVDDAPSDRTAVGLDGQPADHAITGVIVLHAATAYILDIDGTTRNAPPLR